MILNTEAALENYNLVNRVFHGDKDTYCFGGLECNVAPPFTALNSDHGIPDFMKFDVMRVHDVIVRMANQGKFIPNPQYVDCFNQVFGDPQFQRKATGAATDWVLGELVKQGKWPPTTEVVSQILIDAWNQLPDTATFRETKAETEKRNAQISEMTGNGEHGFSIQRGPRKTAYDKTGRVHDPMAGRATGFSLGVSGPWSRGVGSKSFDEMTNEEVDALYQDWKTTSDLRNMSKEDLRKLVNSNGATDLFGKNVRVPSVAAPDTQDRLYHPQSGEAFTQKSLIRFINAAPYNGRDLITKNGRIVPRLRDLFERTVRGELG